MCSNGRRECAVSVFRAFLWWLLHRVRASGTGSLTENALKAHSDGPGWTHPPWGESGDEGATTGSRMRDGVKYQWQICILEMLLQVSITLSTFWEQKHVSLCQQCSQIQWSFPVLKIVRRQVPQLIPPPLPCSDMGRFSTSHLLASSIRSCHRGTMSSHSYVVSRGGRINLPHSFHLAHFPLKLSLRVVAKEKTDSH